MNLESLVKENLQINPKQILFKEPMKKHTSFKIGGNAECFIKINTQDELKEVISFATGKNIPITIVGKGSNILVLDGGIKGITIQINIKKNEIVSKDDKNIEIKLGAGNSNIETAQKFLKEGIAGFEEISGIPGTIGGAIRMNAGAYGKEIKDIVKDVTFMDFEGNIKTLPKEKLKFEYRNSMFSNKKYIILEATFILNIGNKEDVEAKMKEYTNSRKEKQPLDYPSAGSTFKRGEDFITAKLIDECGLKGYSVGGAQISEKHAGFVINKKDAKAKDVLELTNLVKEEILKKFGKEIKLEIEVVGEEREGET